MIKIDRESWTFRTYAFSKRTVESFVNADIGDAKGLCDFMRMMIVWGPAAVLVNAITISTFLFAFVVYPSIVFGARNVMIAWGGLLASAIAIVAATLAIVAVFSFFGAVLSWRKNRSDDSSSGELKEQVQETMSTPRLVCEWIVSIKKRVCPPVTFVSGRS